MSQAGSSLGFVSDERDVPSPDPFYGAWVGLNQQQLSSGLREARAAAALAFGDLQVQLLRELLNQMKAYGAPAAQTVPVQASLDQLEASLRQLRARMADAAARGTTTHAASPRTSAIPDQGADGVRPHGADA